MAALGSENWCDVTHRSDPKSAVIVISISESGMS